MDLKEYGNEIYTAFKKLDGKKLRKLDYMLLSDASLLYSKRLYYFAVIAYVLSKILNKPRFLESKFSDRITAIDKVLKECLCSTLQSNDEEFERHFEKFVNAIKNLEAGDQRFIIDLISKGKLKVAATLYAQGISLGTASEITGIEKHEILSYAGHTMMFDRVREEKDVRERLKTLKRLAEG